MKRISTLLLVLMALMALPLTASAEEVTFDFTSPTIRENIGTAMTDTKGYIYNETFTANNVTLQITAGSAPSRIYVDANRGQNLVTYKEYTTLTFKAPANYAITKIEFTAAGNSNINKVTASAGTIEGMNWTGNADGVRFLQGATTYLANAKVTLAAKDESTTALPAIEYTECANIAAFNALAAGTYAKVTLTDAEVIGKSADGYSTVWIQDATGGCWIQYTSLNDQLQENTKVNGTVYVVKRNDTGKDAHMKEAEDTPNSTITSTKISNYTVTECATITEANAKPNMLVKITGATLTGTSATAGTLTLGEETIKVNNGGATANQQLHKLYSLVKDQVIEDVTMIGIYTVAHGILPLSIEGKAEVADIAKFNATPEGVVVKLALTDARVNALNSLVSPATYYIEDATGATAVKGLSLTTGKLLNGYIVGTKATKDVDYINTPSQGYEFSLTVSDPSLSSITTSDATMTGTPMTIAEACKQENYGKLVTLSNVTIAPISNGKNLQLTDASGSMKTRDLLFALPWDYTWPDKATSFTGIVLYYMTGWFIMPISADAIVAYVQPTEVMFDFENNNMNMAYSTGAANASAEVQNAGNLAGKEIKMNNVTATFVNSPTMATKMAKIGSQKGQLQAIDGGQIRFTAASGHAITKIVITPLNANTKKWAVDNEIGELSTDLLTWTGNASSVRFTATGSLFLTKIVVTTAAKDANTTEAVYDTYTSEVNSIAEFKALENNTLTKLNLTNAAITVRSINEQAFFVQDATGGAHFYFANLDLKVNDQISGYVFVKKSNQLRGTRIAMTEATNADNLTITNDGEVTPVDATVEQASAFTEITAEKYYDSELMNKLVKLTGVKVKGTTETEATITDANDDTKTIRISNNKTNEYPYVIKESLADIDYANATVIGIVCHSQTTTNPKTQYNAIMPISIVNNSGTGISDINADVNPENVEIYNLQGVRQNSLKKGINIVNGKKIIVR